MLTASRRDFSSAWPSRFRPILQRLVDNADRYFGTGVALDPIGQVDRPFSTLLRTRVVRNGPAPAADSPTEVFIKILKPRANTEEQIASMRLNVSRDFEMTSMVCDRLAPFEGLDAVRPIACFPEELAIVTEEASGVSLSDLLLRRSIGWPATRNVEKLTRIVRRVSAWLRAVQSAVSVESTSVSPDGMRIYFDRRLDELQQTRGVRLTSAGRAAVERYRDQLIAGADLAGGGGRSVWIHADFCPENILADERGQRITVLDFTMAKTGTIYHDLAHLYMQLDLMMLKPWFRRGVVGLLQDALLDSFEPGLRADRPLFALVLLQHVLCHLVTLQPANGDPLSRLYAAHIHRRHRRWLLRVAGLDAGSWTR